MSDKERLERIKDIHERAIFEHGDGDRKFELRDIVYILWQEYHTDWLIEQAERTQSVEEENEILKVGALHTANLHHFLQSNRHLLQLKSLGKDVRESAIDTIVALDEGNKRLRKALAFYADDATYETNVTDQWEPVTPVAQDKGKKAKKALEGEQ